MSLRPPQSVQVFTTAQPRSPYREVMLLQAEEANVYADVDEHELLEDLRERAGGLGCDGIIVTPTGNVAKYPPPRKMRPRQCSRTLRGFRAACIVYDTTAPQPAAPQPAAAPLPPAPAPSADPPAAPSPAPARPPEPSSPTPTPDAPTEEPLPGPMSARN